MIREAIATGGTVEAAIEAAKIALDAPEDADVVVEILETPSKKTLGLFGGVPARARAYYEESQFAKAEKYIQDILRLMNIHADVLTVQEDDGVRFSLDCGENDGAVIGRRGETLDALQYLVRLVISRGSEEYHTVNLNVGNYREQREQILREMAASSVAKAKKIGRNISLPAMSAFDRRIVHTVVSASEGVTSFSVGETIERRVVIAPEERYRRSEPRPQRGNFQRNQRSVPGRRPATDRPNHGTQSQSRDGRPLVRDVFSRPSGGYQRRDQESRPPRPYQPGFRSPNETKPREPARSPSAGVPGMSKYGKIEPRRAEKEQES